MIVAVDGPSFGNELGRALARNDIEQLKDALALYYNWSVRAWQSGMADGDFPDEIDIWFDGGEDFDRGLALVMLAAGSYDDAKFLVLVAAGLLEDLVQRRHPPGEERLLRILAEARKTPRFRWMLSGVWRDGMISDQAATVERALDGLTTDDPLPERPWA